MASSSSSSSKIGNVEAAMVQEKETVGNKPLYGSPPEDKFAVPPLSTPFVGRDKEMEELNHLFFVKNYKKIVISGRSGIGKSELAKQFATKCLNRNQIHKVYWINSENESELLESYRSINTQGDKCLFILDNVGSFKSLSKLNERNEYFYLITSVWRDCPDNIFIINLGPLDLHSALKLYKMCLGPFYKVKDLEFMRVAIIVDGIPLFLKITAASICELKKRDDKYSVELYEKELIYMIVKYADGILNLRECEAVVRLSINIITTGKYIHSDLALHTLNVCSYLNPEGINIKMLLKILSIVNEQKTDENMLQEALNLLHNLSLITVSCKENNIRIHRSIQQIVLFNERYRKIEIQDKYYDACFQFLLEYNKEKKYNKSDEDMIFSLLRYADENDIVFRYFYMKNKEILNDSSNIKLLNKLLKYLIKYGCINCIQLILRNCPGNYFQFNLVHRTAQYNQIGIFKLLLEYGFEVNSRDENKNTPMHVAMYEWNLELVNSLLSYGADLYALNNHGNTPLFELSKGAFNGYYVTSDEIRNILNKFLYLELRNSTNFNGETLLHVASSSLNVELVKLLLEKYKLDVNKMDNRGRTPLYAAISKSNRPFATNEKISAISALLKRSGVYASHDNMTLFERALATLYQFSLLDQLITNNELLRKTLKNNIDVNNVDKHLNSLLHIASFHGNLEAIKILKQQNAIKTEKNNSGNTPLFEFVRGIYYHENNCLYDEMNEILDLLYYENAKNNSGETILHAAAASHNADLTNILITKYKINANVLSYNQQTPLHVLFPKLTEHDITNNLLRILETILQLKLDGASLEIKDEQGMTPVNIVEKQKNDLFLLFLLFDDRYVMNINEILNRNNCDAEQIITNFNLLHYAIVYNHLKVLKLLLTFNIDVNNKNDKQLSPLHLAALHWNIDAIKILINHGADVNITNDDGRKPIHYFFLGATQTRNLNDSHTILELLSNNEK